MCGICGFVAGGQLVSADLERMCRALAHRGPDDEGFFFDGQVGLANRRLSVIDTVAGHQPIGNEDGSVQLVFNGEIYNYRDLRAELQAAGHRFSTQSDTEVLVHLYEERGRECIEKLRGMFAFALWDSRRSELFLARDRLGQKPLFYVELDRGLAFASEIKALLELDQIMAEMDPVALQHYLSLRFVPPPHTMFKGIRKLPPGHAMTYREGRCEVFRYWQLDFREKIQADEQEALATLDAEMRDAVESHLVSDVPVGAFLSGGMDSSAIVAMMSQMEVAGLETFAIGVEEQSFNELPYARTVAEYCGTSHREARVEANLIADLPRMIHHLDEPSDPIAACMYQASRLASQHVKVVLGGDGGDELFAGFDRYLGVRALESARWVPLALRQVAESLVQRVPESFAYKSLTQKLRWVSAMAAQPDAARRYAQATIHTRFSHEQKSRVLGDTLWRLVSDLDAATILIDAYNEAPALDPIDRMLYTDYTTRLPEHSLQMSDRMSMAHSLELRSPFLDHQLVELGARLPSRLKIRRGTLKYALKKTMASRLPNEILQRPKQGFMFPIAFWFQGALSGFLEEVFKESWIVKHGVVQHEPVARLIDEHRRGMSDHHVRLWMLLNLEVWSRLFLEGESEDRVSEDLRRRLRAPGT
jgi:asparagine synthase (glutamine-hydrolysing)